MAIVDVSFSPLPAHVRTARLIALAVARRVGVAEDMLDEVRLAVGEACSRAVGIHAELAADAPISMRLSDDDARFTVEVTDIGPLDDDSRDAPFDALDGTVDPAAWEDDAAGSVPAGFGLVVIAGIVDEVVVSSDASGTHVTMAWPVLAAT